MPLRRKSFYLNFELKKRFLDYYLWYDLSIPFFNSYHLKQDLKQSQNVDAAIRNIKPTSWISIEIWLQFLLPTSDLN